MLFGKENNLMEQAKISIIVPVYQVGKYLRRCLDSIVNQTYKNLEIILVEDGSSDNSPAICEEYAQKDGRIKVFYQKNQGASVARNQGLDVATGKYIGFVDSDDWIEPNMYEELSFALVNSNADVAVTGYFLELKEGNKSVSVDAKRYGTPEKFLEGTILDKNAAISSVWSKLFKKELFDKVRFVPDLRCEDNICMVDLFEKKPRVAFVDIPLYHYNKSNEQSVTKQVEPKMEYGYFIFLKKYLQMPFEFLQNQNVKQQIKADILKRAIRCYIEDLVVPQMSKERLEEVDAYLRNDDNYSGTNKLKVRHRILCWFYNHCRWILKWYAKIRY